MNLIEFLNDLLVNRAEDLAVRMGDSDFDGILRGKNIRSGTGGRNGSDGQSEAKEMLAGKRIHGT